MNLNGLNQREKILGIATAIFIVAILLFTGILEPQVKRHRNLQKELNDLQVRYTKMQADVKMRDRINHAYDQVQHLLENAETEQQQTSIFTRELSDIYSSQNLKVKSVKILPSLKEKHYIKLTVKADLRGNVQFFIKLIEHLEQLNKPIQIESFELRAMESTDIVQISLLITKIVKTTKV